jgi:hypothetical protein
MSDSIFKAIVTHFEANNTRLQFGNTIYEIFPSEQNECFLFKGSSTGDGPELVESNIPFDEACIFVAKDVESYIVNHWRK